MENSSGSFKSPQELVNITTLKKEVFSFVWSICQFDECMSRKYEFLSPIFCSKSMQETKWKMMVYPESVYPEGLHVGLRLLKASDDNEIFSVVYTISVVDVNGRDFLKQTREKVFKNHLSHDDCVIISNTELREKNFLPNGSLTISCKMDVLIAVNPQEKSCDSQPPPYFDSNPRYNSVHSLPETMNANEIKEYSTSLKDRFKKSGWNSLDDSKNTKTSNGLELLSNDLKSLYMNKHQYDVVIHVDDGEIFAHRTIIVARSEYFRKVCSSMGTTAGNSNIYISEIKTNELDAVLHYLYSGQLPQLTYHLAIDILFACKILQLDKLHDEIQSFLITQINVNNVSDIFSISKEMKMDKLKNCALKFVSKNHAAVADTEEWNEMMRNNPHAAGEVLLTVASFQKKPANTKFEWMMKSKDESCYNQKPAFKRQGY